MTDSKTLFDQNVINQALHAQKNVGAQLKVRNPRAENAARQRRNRDAFKGGLKIERSPSGKRGQGGRSTGATTYRNKGKLKRTQGFGSTLQKWIDRLKGKGEGKGGSFLGKMTPEGIAAAGEAASSVFNTLDMLTGGQDKILPGSGHTYSSGYNPEMYIGQGPGY